MKHNQKLTKNAQNLRKNMTKEEARLWYQYLCRTEDRFHRQFVIGNYIVDFYCSSKKIVIELDGSQHYEEENREKDILRDNYLNSLGLTVLRYTNIDIHNDFDAVCRDIYNHLDLI